MRCRNRAVKPHTHKSKDGTAEEFYLCQERTIGVCATVPVSMTSNGKPLTICSANCPFFRESLNGDGKVDVVVTSHNYGRFLDEALDSLRNQEGIGNVIVVDDASDADDQTKGICERREVRYLRTEFKSPHLARGAGFAQCKSPLVHFLDADNTLKPGYLDEAMILFDANPRLAIVYPDLTYFGDEDRTLFTPPAFDMAKLERTNFIDTGSVWRREAILQVNGFGSESTGWEDWHLARSIMRSGAWEAAHNPIALNYRKHGEQRIQNRDDKSYYSMAGLAGEVVTVFLTVSGRSHKTANFQRHKEWLLSQAWPREQIRVLIANTSHQPLPPEWLIGLDGFAGVSWYDHPVGSPGLEDMNRADAPAIELEVQTVVAAINNRMLKEAQTEFVLSLENDVFPKQPDAIEQLLRWFDTQVCAVGGAYRQRYEPQAWTAWDHMPANGRPKLIPVLGKGIQNIHGTGFGCVMLRMSQVRDEVITGQTAVSGYYDADWFHRHRQRGRQVRVNWGVTCEHGGVGCKLTILIPTVGRNTLERTLRSVRKQLREEDEIILVADGVKGIEAKGVTLIELDENHNDWGHTPRNLILPTITSGYVVHFDDDDTLANDALKHVRQAIARHNGDLFLFQMRREDGSLIPDGNELRCGNVGTPMFVHPAGIDLGKFGEGVYAGDCEFITQTVERNPQRELRWIPQVICNIRHEEPEPVKPDVSQPRSEFAPCANLGDVLRVEGCAPCHGSKVEVRACSQFRECAPRRFKNVANPHVCDRQCVRFTGLVELQLSRPVQRHTLPGTVEHQLS